MLKKYQQVFLCVLLITVVAVRISGAAFITPDLRQAMRFATPSQNVPVIINMADRVDLDAVATADRLAHKKGDVKVLKRGALVKALKGKADLSQAFLKALLEKRGAKKMKSLWITNSVAVTVPSSLISELMSLPEIGSIELDAIIEAPGIVPAATATPEWNVDRVNAPLLWDVGINGSGVVVANLDTGVDVTHPDLGPKWRGGACSSPPDCDSWFDPYTNSTQPYDLAGFAHTGHGTGTMGIMVGGSDSDAYGVAPGAKWIAAKIFDDAGNASESNILLAMQWLLSPGGDATNAPDVVNNSWGYNSPGQCYPALPNALETAIQTVRAAGIAMVFSAGNSGPNLSTSVSPANYPGSFAVGATDSADNIYFLGSRGPSACDGGIFPNVVAPGVGITTSAPSDTLPAPYQTVSGTSFSAPHAAGAAALLISAFPSISFSRIEAALQQTAMNIGEPATVPNITYGYGLINVSRALSYLTRHGDISLPEIVGYPASFDYGTVDTTSPLIWQTFTITNRSDAIITVTSVVVTGADDAAFSISGDACSGNSLAPLTSCTFTVKPVSYGTKVAQIHISYDITDYYDVPLNGNLVPPVARVQGSTVVATYSAVQKAYTDCSSGDIVGMLAATTYYESPNFNSLSNIKVSLQGGYDPSFGFQSGFTTLLGTFTVSNGTVTVGNLILQ